MISADILPGTRVLYPGENDTLNLVASKKPGIYKHERGGVCQNAPKNFLGALLLGLNKDTNIDVLAEGIFEIPRQIDRPFVLLKDVPLSVHHSGEGYEQLGLTAESVLFKMVCGTRLGVILTGDLSGIILQPQNNKEPAESMCINKAWNDRLLTLTDFGFPYNPDFDLNPTLKYREAAARREKGSTYADTDEKASKIMWKLFQSFRGAYTREVGQAQEEMGDEVFESVLFLRFCQRLGIEVDTQNFHVTREFERV